MHICGCLYFIFNLKLTLFFQEKNWLGAFCNTYFKIMTQNDKWEILYLVMYLTNLVQNLKLTLR